MRRESEERYTVHFFSLAVPSPTFFSQHVLPPFLQYVHRPLPLLFIFSIAYILLPTSPSSFFLICQSLPPSLQGCPIAYIFAPTCSSSLLICLSPSSPPAVPSPTYILLRTCSSSLLPICSHHFSLPSLDFPPQQSEWAVALMYSSSNSVPFFLLILLKMRGLGEV